MTPDPQLGPGVPPHCGLHHDVPDLLKFVLTARPGGGGLNVFRLMEALTCATNWHRGPI